MRTRLVCAALLLVAHARPAAAQPEGERAPPPVAPAPASRGPWDHLKIQAYVQAQFLTQRVNEAASPNLRDGRLPEGVGANDVVAKPDGTTTNTTLLRLRRTRLRLKYETEHVRVFLQLDPFPAGGPSAAQGTMARNAEVTGIIRWTDDVRTEIGAGLMDIPLRFELLESAMTRPFLERTWAVGNLFPGERDIGVRAKTVALGERLVVETIVFNGHRLGQPRFVELADLDASKDTLARAEYRVGPVRLGVFGYSGQGALVDAERLLFSTYPRRAVNFGVELQDEWLPSLGKTRASAELLFGRNMDAGGRYAFAVPALFAPSAGSVHRDERALHVRAEQELGEVPVVGLRYDTYTPDAAVSNNARDTFALTAALRIVEQLRVVLEGSYAIDDVHPRGAAPPSKHVLQLSLWMQGGFY